MLVGSGRVWFPGRDFAKRSLAEGELENFGQECGPADQPNLGSDRNPEATKDLPEKMASSGNRRELH